LKHHRRLNVTFMSRTVDSEKICWWDSKLLVVPEGVTSTSDFELWY